MTSKRSTNVYWLCLHLTGFGEFNFDVSDMFEETGKFAPMQAWKGHDWAVLDRLYEKGFIRDPKNKNKSLTFTREGSERSKELFEKLFGKSN